MKRSVVLLLLTASLVYGSITFVNHCVFRTYALDLGYYTQVSLAWIAGEAPTTAGFEDLSQHALSNHFDLSQLIFAPFVAIGGAWALLIIQWLFILLGGIGIYKWAEHHKSKFSTPILLCFLGYFAVFQSLAYDYHSTVVACMLLPWYFLAIAKGKTKLSWVLLITFALFREDLALFALFIAAGQTFIYRRDLKLKPQLIGQVAGMAVLFLLIMLVIMPAFAGGEPISNLQYLALQNFQLNFGAVARVFKEILYSSPEGSLSMIKVEFWFAFLLSGGVLLFKKPVYLFMLIPVFSSKMLHINPIFWGVGAHYSIALAAIVPIALVVILKDSKHSIWKFLPLVVLAVSFRLMDNPYSIIDRENIRFYQAQHYQRTFDVNQVKQFLNSIPEHSLVSTSNNVYPHLADQQEVQLFPLGIAKADYIILINEDDPFPLGPEEHSSILASIHANESWEQVQSPQGTTVFHRNKK